MIIFQLKINLQQKSVKILQKINELMETKGKEAIRKERHRSVTRMNWDAKIHNHTNKPNATPH